MFIISQFDINISVFTESAFDFAVANSEVVQLSCLTFQETIETLNLLGKTSISTFCFSKLLFIFL